MSNLPTPQATVAGSGSTGKQAPNSLFAFMLYRDAHGRLIKAPVRVAGDQITYSVQGPAAPQP